MNIERHTCAADELTWFKSSHSGTNGGDCVEVAIAPHTVHVRDSKRAAGLHLRVSRRAWSGFLTGVAARRT
ncbi:DUF397 domain-containing protein [Streptomyces lycii]|uniref:DUF397 domain-containing protein n=1 Tax=Streptomyces lycii TaxID=2654337 RepID=A0ABQ7FQA1_9ACTN|nr:DUF397 domain-containing protein [Streptomyces lycii]KAF4411101.1 DUF397 domain-containing protein [Streptomyces lycii]